MSRYEYTAILIGILVGLALSNILTSAHKLMEARGRVQWDWMAPTTALSAAVLTLGFFWGQWRQWMNSAFHTQTHYYVISSLPNIGGFCLLFLACAATLPDDVPEQGVNLRSYYFENRRRFWTLFALMFASVLASWAIACIRTASLEPIRQHPSGIAVSVPGLVLSVASLLTSAPLWHRIAVIGSLVLFLVIYGPMQIG